MRSSEVLIPRIYSELQFGNRDASARIGTVFRTSQEPRRIVDMRASGVTSRGLGQMSGVLEVGRGSIQNLSRGRS